MTRYDQGVSVGLGDIGRQPPSHQSKQRPEADGSVTTRCESGIKFVALSQARNEGFERVYKTEHKFSDSYTERAGAEPKHHAREEKKVYETEPKFLDSYTLHAGAEPKSQAQATPNKYIRDRTQVLRLVMQ